jgi:type IV pilus assembly protein PilP
VSIMKHSMSKLCWSVVLLGAFSVGCGGDKPKRGQGTQATPDAAAPQAETERSEADEAVAPEYVYNPIGKRDPFRTFIATADEEEIRSPTPLQRYELEQYELTGIVWGVDRPRALVEDPEGTGHVIELGTYVGKKWGKVTQITSSQLVVTEEYLTPDGALVVNPIEIKLQYPDEELR